MFIELLSTCAILSFGESLAFNSKRPIKYVSVNNHPCQANRKLVDPSAVRFNKFGESCSTIDDLYSRVCVLNEVKI